MQQQAAVLNVAALAGELLLASGAEVFRVEDTMHRIAAAYGCHTLELFVIGNGIFVAATDQGGTQSHARVRDVPIAATRLDRIDAVNALSRSIQQGQYTPSQAFAALQRIQSLPQQPRPLRIAASGLGSAAFCLFYGGSFADSLAAGAAGLCLAAYFLLVVQGRLSKMAMNLSGAMLATLVGVLLHRLGLGQNLALIATGAIIPLLPGVAFTGAIRDIAHEDYLSGTVRLLDVFLCVAASAFGATLVLSLFGGV